MRENNAQGLAQGWGTPSRKIVPLMVIAPLLTWMGYYFQPKLTGEEVTQAELEALIPASFGDWAAFQGQVVHVSTSVPSDQSMDQPYDAQISRTYKNSRGDIVILAVAYGKNQRQEIKVHRPEVCYSASGRDVSALLDHAFKMTSSGGIPVTGKQMIAYDKRTASYEAVTYWVRVGHTFASGGLSQRMHILSEGLKGRRSDGILVRFSQITNNKSAIAPSYELQNSFATELYNASSPVARRILVN
jgi:EpsI family protein